jgi:hypothetical protein
VTHTPGPWRVDKTINGGYVRSDNSKVLGAAGIAKVLRGRGYDDGEANARLIAAAPELLATLHEIRKWMDGEIMGAWDAKFIAQIDAVLAKAEGKA